MLSLTIWWLSFVERLSNDQETPYVIITPKMADLKYALVFGASGVTGWALVNEILNDYPQKGIFGGVIALTNRPLTLEQSRWPKDDRLSIVSGIDLLKGSQEDVEKTMKDKIPNLDKVTDHLFFGMFPRCPKEPQPGSSLF